MAADHDYNRRVTILFLHGWQSVRGGVKPTYLKDHGHTVINPKLPDDDFEEAVRIAQAAFDKHRPRIVVGSSRGGAVAMNINSGDAWLVLLCPPWKKWGTAKTVKPSTVILHSKADDAVPFTDSQELVRNSELPAWTLIEVGNDHQLADPESLDKMLEACADDVDEFIEGVTSEDLLEKDWTGDCYGAVINWVSVAEEENWSVVHGITRTRPNLAASTAPKAARLIVQKRAKSRSRSSITTGTRSSKYLLFDRQSLGFRIRFFGLSAPQLIVFT
jgi:hypothetical protein